MDDADEFALRMLLQRGGDLLVRKNIAPGNFDSMHGRAAAFHHVLHASAEDAVHADNDLVARLDQVHGDTFHSRHAGTAYGKGQRIFRLENLAQHFAGLVEDSQILRIEMTESGRRERAQHARRNRTRAGTKQDALDGKLGVHVE